MIWTPTSCDCIAIDAIYAAYTHTYSHNTVMYATTLLKVMCTQMADKKY